MLFAGISLAAVGESSFEFMLIGAGSRASSMGEAFTAVSGDAGAAFFNPASIGVMNGSEISLAHAEYLQDVTMEQVSVVSRSGSLRLGLSLNIGQVADIQRRDTNPSGDPLGLFNEHNVTLSFFGGRPVSEKLSLGLAAKVAYEKLDLESASALAFDLGAFYSITSQISVGGSIRNLGTKPKFVNVAYDLPREMRLGFSYRTPVESRWAGILLAADYLLPKWGDGSSKLNLGAEYNYDNFVFLRGGYDLGYDSRSLAVGTGLAYRDYFFDYAFVPIKHNLSNTHRFTLRIRL